MSGPPRAGVVVLLLVAVTGAQAHAAGDKDTIRRLEGLGREAYGAGEYKKAIAAFRAAHKESKDPKFLYNIARPYEKADNLPKAIKYLERYIPKAPSRKDRNDAKAMVAFLQARLEGANGELQVTVEPKGARVVVSGAGTTREGSGSVSASLKPGKYSVTFEYEGYRTESREVEVIEDESVELKVMLLKEVPPAKPKPQAEPKAEPPPAVAEQPVEVPPPHRRRRTRTRRPEAVGPLPGWPWA